MSSWNATHRTCCPFTYSSIPFALCLEYIIHIYSRQSNRNEVANGMGVTSRLTFLLTFLAAPAAPCKMINRFVSTNVHFARRLN